MSDDRLLIAEQVAELLSVKVSWVRQKTKDGELPSVPLPGRYKRYLRSDIDAWIEKLREGGDA